MEYSREQIANSFERLEASGRLAESSRLRELLAFLKTEVLAGRGDRLKGYTIGVEVFGKSEDFDPSQDSIVRVQMSRLRAALEEYYAGPGRHDDPRICLTAGDYNPSFEPPLAPTPPPATAAEVEQDAESGAEVELDGEELATVEDVNEVRRLLFALLVLVLAVVFWPWLFPSDDPVTLAVERPDGPVVVVGSYYVSGPDAEIADGLRDGLQYDLVTNLAHLPRLAVIGYDSVADRQFSDLSQIDDQADFLLTGAITLDQNNFRVNSSLVRTRDGVVIWSQASEPTILSSGNFLEAQADIALSVAAELGQPYGVIHEAMRRDAASHDNVSLARYFCELDAYGYMRTKNAAARGEVRTCLEQAVEDAGNYSDAWALLAWIYGDDYRLGREGDIARSLAAAQRAVSANSTNASAYIQLAIAQFYAGNDAATLDAVDRALRLAPNDTEILANASWILAIVEDNPEAPALAAKAMELNPGHPPWYWFGPLVSALRNGDAQAAVRAADLYAVETTQLPYYLRAAAYRMAGNRAEAASSLRRAQEGRGADREAVEQDMLIWRLPDTIEQMVLAVADDAASLPDQGSDS